ncbi:hypothetical protein FZM77_16525 [Enterococcus faecium]|nr:hypothetical protein [Enterococcus faecium]MCZ1527526.1 hypothetical protein [Enterococcus faecium]
MDFSTPKKSNFWGSLHKILVAALFSNKRCSRSNFLENKPKFLEAKHFCHNLFSIVLDIHCVDLKLPSIKSASSSSFSILRRSTEIQCSLFM